VLDGSCQLREDGSAALERLDRGQRAPASVVPTSGLTREPSRAVFMSSSASKMIA